MKIDDTVTYYYQGIQHQVTFNIDGVTLPILKKDESFLNICWGKRISDKGVLPIGSFLYRSDIKKGHYTQYNQLSVKLPLETCALGLSEKLSHIILSDNQLIQGIYLSEGDEQRVYIAVDDMNVDDNTYLPRIIETEKPLLFSKKYSNIDITAEDIQGSNNKWEIEIDMIEKINLALQQNAVPIINMVRIINNTPKKYRDIELQLISNPRFSVCKKWMIDSIEANSEIILQNNHIELNPTFLSEVTEAINGEWQFTLTSDNEILTRKNIITFVLTKNEWFKLKSLPEIFAAFVEPNDPAVSKILRLTSNKLAEAGLTSSLEGYQLKNPKRVATIISALWSVISEMKLTYTEPPASFEITGQRVRSPSMVIDIKLATCIDTAILFLSVIEQCGLNGIIIFTKGHAFCGCWLQEGDSTKTIINDAQELRKRIQLNEIIVFETTLVTGHSSAFTFAKSEAEKTLNNDNQFEMAIDISNARKKGIRPLSSRTQYQYLAEEDDQSFKKIDLDIPIDIPEIVPLSQNLWVN
jgi:hypothetical protein